MCNSYNNMEPDTMKFTAEMKTPSQYNTEEWVGKFVAVPLENDTEVFPGTVTSAVLQFGRIDLGVRLHDGRFVLIDAAAVSC